MEKVVQEAYRAVLEENDFTVETEVPLSTVGAKRPNDSANGRIDIVSSDYGIELKVVSIPRSKARRTAYLWDIGQISFDHWTIRNAKKLSDGELGILLYGPFVTSLESSTEILREFHNKMFVDYKTSSEFGELKRDLEIGDPEMKRCRKRQISSIEEMKMDLPYSGKNGCKIFVHKSMALVVIPVHA